MLTRSARILALVALAGSALTARADEGMWLINKPPMAALKAHGFEPSPAFMDAMQKSAVRFNVGGSGSIVSAQGLVMTNHHVASDTLAKLSTAQNNLLDKGFHARTLEQELKCPDLELNVLWTIEDVTAKVNAATAGKSGADAAVARRAAIATIEKDSQDKTGLQSQVVTLYNGGQYHLYCYKRFTDVRLVFAPDKQAAFFGGDTDNFEFPRFNLDCTFFRIYENDKPLKPEHHLAWSPDGSKEGDLALVFGHPGGTRRGLTADHTKYLRDHEMPDRLRNLWRSEIKAQTFAGRSAENRRIIEDDLFGIANSRKASTGIMAGLADPAIIAAKDAAEQQLKSSIAKLQPDEAQKTFQAFADVKKTLELQREIGTRQRALNSNLGSDLAAISREIVRLAAELPKPSAQRLREFGDARLPSLYDQLYSPAPIYPAKEIAAIESGLTAAVERLGGDDPAVKLMLAGKSPAARARELVAGTTVMDPAARKKLVEGGQPAVDAAARVDPLIALMIALDPEARALRLRGENEIESTQREAYAKIAAARFAALGDSVYPDATFSLRLSFGPIKGYADESGPIPAYTTLGGLFTRGEERKGQEGFDIPEAWTKAKGSMKLDTPFNFVCTADIIGGNSGSPVVNTKGEVIGIIFDGNIHSLVGDIQYSGDGLGRAVSVDSRGMIEALRSVYNATELVAELTGK